MSGHNKWSQIQHQKSAADRRRSILFSKILNAISIAARNEADPRFNPRLRTLIDKAKENNIPQENIQRAIKKITENKNLEEVFLEAYGPGGVAMIIECITDNRNRTVAEIRHKLGEYGARIAEMGGVRWAFDGDNAKFPKEAAMEDHAQIQKLIQALDERDDVQRVITDLKHENIRR